MLSGDLVAAEGLKLKEGVSTSADSKLAAEEIEIKEDTIVEGDVYYNELDNDGSISGILNALDLPTFDNDEIPAFVFGTPGTQDIKVGKNETMIITPGDYDDIHIEDGGTLILDGAGICNFDSIKLDKNASLLADATDDVEVRVQDDLKTDENAR